MRIKELEIKNFGKFSRRKFEFQDRIQVIYGENEFGKSTIYACIKALLFGMERGRGKAAQNDMFSRFEPWENPNEYAGVLRFSCGGKMFRLERRFDRYSKSASLICEDDGEELSVEHGDLDVLLNGMTAEKFENTAAITQFGARPGQSLAQEIQNYAANYYETGNSGVDLAGAEIFLKRRQKEVEKKQKALEEETAGKRREIWQKYQYLQQELEKLQEEKKEQKQQIVVLEKPVQSRTQDVSKGRNWQLFAALLCLLIGGLLHNLYSFIPVILAVLFGCWWFMDGKRQKADLQKEQKEEEHAYREDVRKRKWTLQRIQEEEKEKKILLNHFKEQAEELEEPGEEQRKLKRTLQALQLAANTMEKTAAAISRDFGTVLNERASEILKAVTSGAYTRLLVEEPLKLILWKEGQRIPVERVSRGTAEQVYFALRMAALDLLYGEEMPVVFDDAFGCYDEKRLKDTLKWLSQQPRQVIIFSCQKRENELLEQIRQEKADHRNKGEDFR